jgi:hypothetical protein
MHFFSGRVFFFNPGVEVGGAKEQTQLKTSQISLTYMDPATNFQKY